MRKYNDFNVTIAKRCLSYRGSSFAALVSTSITRDQWSSRNLLIRGGSASVIKYGEYFLSKVWGYPRHGFFQRGI